MTAPPVAYEIESLNKEIKRNFIKEYYFTELDSLLKSRPNFSALGSLIELSRQEPITNFTLDGIINDFLRFIADKGYEKSNLSPSPMDITI